MTESATTLTYLTRLDAALADVDPVTARDIRSGIVEELTGLDDTAAAERIVQLGDPLAIAAAARREQPPRSPAQAPQTGIAERSRRTSGFVIMTSIAVGIGGVVIPFVGWIAGVIMMWLSPLWHTWEKVVVTLAPVVITGASVGLLAGAAGDAGFSWRHLALLAGPIVVSLATGIWLLLTGLRRC